MSSFGGAIRIGELLPTSPPITHALKLEFYAHEYYYFNYSSNDYTSCYTWPAVGCDSYWNQPAAGYNGTTNSYIKPGALLAVPPNEAGAVNDSLLTIPGKKILDALTNYGGYIVDDTACPSAAICMEHAVNGELIETYGYSVAIENPLTSTQGADFFADLVTIFRALAVVTNNAVDNVGGGGNPRAPAPPPFC